MKVLSLCSGVGGAELALKQSDIDAEVIGYAEIDKFASSIYERHFPNHTNLGDLTKIKVEELEDFDMLISGIPCQAFSVAGKQKGFADTRGTIFFDVARILKAKKPKYFLIENVKNFLSHDKGNTFQVIASTLLELGYNIRWDILNSKDFGVPQNRERIYIRGILKEYGDLPDISLTAADLLMGTDVNHDVRMQREIINRKIKARVHQVDIKNLQRTLRAAKKQSTYTIKEIADKIDVPATQAEHYFKTGGSFAIPTPTIWSKLKDVLDITTDEFDKSLIEFEIKDQSKKAYKGTGISPTITANGDVLIQQTEMQSLNSKVPQGMRLLDTNGISCTQAALGGGWGAKCLCIDTLIPTDNGFKKMKDIKVGDKVFNANGDIVKVVFASDIMYNHKCYKITFNNGEEIFCDDEHIWNVSTIASRKSNNRSKNPQPLYQNIVTKDMVNNVDNLRKNGKHEYNYRILNPKPIQSTKKDLPIPPYTLGAWLGDGIAKNGAIVGMDQEIFNRISKDGYELRLQPHSVADEKKSVVYGILGLQKQLRENNLLKNKHIPDIYLFGNIEQRLDLLSGLMDTDGTIRKNGSMSFTNTNKQIIDSIKILLASLGIQSGLKYYSKEQTKGKNDAYEVAFITTLPIFNVQRKKDRQKDVISSRKKSRSIINIEEVESFPVKCIKVDDKDGLFLCSEHFIPTHNTGLYKIPKPLKIATATKKGYDEVYPGDGVRLDHPGSATGRGRTQSKGVGTLTCSSNWGAVDYNFRVRRLMPIEVERLQSFPDNWTQYGKDGEEISDSQRYKCMGNAFTVNVIKYILNSFYDKEVSLNGENN